MRRQIQRWRLRHNNNGSTRPQTWRSSKSGFLISVTLRICGGTRLRDSCCQHGRVDRPRRLRNLRRQSAHEYVGLCHPPHKLSVPANGSHFGCARGRGRSAGQSNWVPSQHSSSRRHILAVPQSQPRARACLAAVASRTTKTSFGTTPVVDLCEFPWRAHVASLRQRLTLRMLSHLDRPDDATPERQRMDHSWIHTLLSTPLWDSLP